MQICVGKFVTFGQSLVNTIAIASLRELRARSHRIARQRDGETRFLKSVRTDSVNVDQREITAGLKLQESVDRLKARQLAAENRASLNGMTVEEATQYKKRHALIKRLTQQLLDLEESRPQAALEGSHEQEEPQEAARHCAEGD